MSKYGVAREGASVVACSFVAVDECCCDVVHSCSNGDILQLNSREVITFINTFLLLG